MSPDSISTPRSLSTAELEAVVCRLSRRARPLRDSGDDSAERGGTRILRTPDYDVWLLRWPPGTRVTPHDHGDSAGAFVVIDGDLIELRWHGSIPECRLITRGETVPVARGVVHDVVATNRVAHSIHAYSPPLESMSFYRVPPMDPGTEAGMSARGTAIGPAFTPPPAPVTALVAGV